MRQALKQVILHSGYERRDTPFALSSGGTSYDYVDLRRALSKGEDLELAARCLIGALQDHSVAFDAIGGMTMGADPIAHAVALITHKSWFSVRKATKDHGAMRRIEGAQLGDGLRVVLVEDTISTGRSALEALAVVQSTGAEVVMAATLLDRGESAAKLFAEHRVDYISILDYAAIGIEPLSERSFQH